jgi:uncharacterized protein
MDRGEKQRALQRRLRELGQVAVAYSGGVDSAYLLWEATQTLGAENALGITAVSPSLPASERECAERLAQAHGFNHLLIETNENENSDYAANPTNRCYFCKSTLYEHAIPVARERGFQWIATGTNADDIGDWRPGLRAAEENGALHPMLEVGLTKEDIRALALEAGLDVWDKPAAACLASRIPHGTAVTTERLSMIELAEEFLKREIRLRVVRVRWDDGAARIECDPSEIATAAQSHGVIAARFTAIGFTGVSLDLRGYRRGSLHEHLIQVSVGDQ